MTGQQTFPLLNLCKSKNFNLKEKVFPAFCAFLVVRSCKICGIYIILHS